jgi:hypothetical protein
MASGPSRRRFHSSKSSDRSFDDLDLDRLGGRRRDRSGLDDLPPEDEKSDYDEIITHRFLKRPRREPSPDEYPTEAEMPIYTVESLMHYFRMSDPRFNGLLTDYCPTSGRKTKLLRGAPTLPYPMRTGAQNITDSPGPEGLREAVSLANAGFGYLFASLFEGKLDFVPKGIELCAAAFTKLEEERMEQALCLEKGAVGAALGPQDLPRAVTHAYAMRLFQQGAGGSQLPGRSPARVPALHPTALLPFGVGTYPGAPIGVASGFSPIPPMLPAPKDIEVGHSFSSPSPRAVPTPVVSRAAEQDSQPLATTGATPPPESQSQPRLQSQPRAQPQPQPRAQPQPRTKLQRQPQPRAGTSQFPTARTSLPARPRKRRRARN